MYNLIFFCAKVKTSGSYLLVGEFLSRVCLLWMIEPVDPDHHVAAPGLPHALDAANKGQVGSPSRQEHGTVTDADHLSAAYNRLVEELLGLALHTSSLEGEDGGVRGMRDGFERISKCQSKFFFLIT